jgi:trimethylamine--corrinoid protein Co-methyltransferase
MRNLWLMKPGTLDKRHATISELAEVVRVLDALPNIHTMLRPFSFLADHPAEMEMLLVHATMVRNSTKVPYTVAYEDMSKWLILIYEAAGIQTLAGPSVSSPLSIADDQCQSIISYAQAGHPILVYGGAAKNGSGPATIAGCLVLGNAQALGATVLAQLANPGIGIVYSVTPDVLDMQYGSSSVGSPEIGLIGAASAQMARHHGIPSSVWSGGSDSKLPDSQAAYEKQLQAILCAQAGVNLIYMAGALDSENIFSPAQAVIDHEVISMVGTVINGFEVNQETLAVDLIKEVGPLPGNFLGVEHTRQHWRDETFLPRIGTRQTYDAWKQDGGLSALDRATALAGELAQSHTPEPLPDEVEKEIVKILASAQLEKIG